MGHTDKVIYLKDNEIALIRRGKEVEIESLENGRQSNLDIKTLKMSVEQLEKGGYDTFMLKEISYIRAEGYPTAEMKHGPIALVDSEMPTVVAIITKGNSSMNDIADHCIEVPDVPECLTPIVVSVPLQLMAYYIAMNKGRNVDQPRNLAKSVTVE